LKQQVQKVYEKHVKWFWEDDKDTKSAQNVRELFEKEHWELGTILKRRATTRQTSMVLKNVRQLLAN
jgi:hypothetical protein